MSKELKAAAKVAAQKRIDDLLELEEILLSGECLKDALFQGLVAAFETGFVAGHMAGRTYAYVTVETLFAEFMAEFGLFEIGGTS
jgi:hypothetical protein